MLVDPRTFDEAAWELDISRAGFHIECLDFRLAAKPAHARQEINSRVDGCRLSLNSASKPAESAR